MSYVYLLNVQNNSIRTGKRNFVLHQPLYYYLVYIEGFLSLWPHLCPKMSLFRKKCSWAARNMSELLYYATIFTISELQETKTSEYHRISHSPLDYRILLMDEDQDRIYVGSKDHILSLNINNISQDPLSVSSSFILRIWGCSVHAFAFKTKK